MSCCKGDPEWFLQGEVIATQESRVAELVSTLQQERERHSLALTNEEVWL